MLTCGLLALGAGHAYADQQKLPSGTPYDQIGQKIEDYYKEHEKTSAGLATSVFDKDGQTIYQNNFGYVDKEKKLAVDDNSVFEWGSATKLTVWVSVMQLWEEGKIDLKTDIKEYLPKDFLKGKLTYDKPITMLDLMNHQAGNQTRKEIMAYPLLPRLEDPAFPITVTFGDNDIFGASGHFVISRYPSAQVFTIKNSGHFPFFHNPEDYFAILHQHFQP